MPLKIEATKSEKEVEHYTTKRNAFLNMTGAEIDVWVDTNVNNLNDVKKVLKFLAKAVKVSIKK